MPNSLIYAHNIGILSGAVVSLSTVLVGILKFHKHKQIDQIRRRLIQFGIGERKVIREWVRQWSVELEDRPDSNPAKKLLSDELSREALIQALVELAAIPNPPEPGKFLARLFFPIVSTWQLLFPAATGSQSRDILQTQADIITGLLGRIHATRSAGEIIAVGPENITLYRLLRETHCGEIWLGVASDQLEPQTSATTRKPIYRDIHFFTSDVSRKHISDDKHALKAKLEQLGKHKNIVQFFHLGFDGDGIPFLVTEHVAGRSLQGWMADNDDERVALDKGRVMAGLTAALADAHGKNIFHRHLDPESILLTEPFVPGSKADNVQAKIADFCVSRYIAVFNPTSMYLPPEASQPDERDPAQDDMFALGVIWYQLLIGRSERPPYDFNERLHQEGHDAATIRQLSRCLAHPDRRWINAEELQNAMQKGAAQVALTTGLGGGVNSDIDPDVVIDGYDVSGVLQEYLASLA